MSVVECMKGDSTNVCVEATGEGSCCALTVVTDVLAKPTFSQKKAITALTDAGFATTVGEAKMICAGKDLLSGVVDGVLVKDGVTWTAACTEEDKPEEEPTGAMAKAAVAVSAVATIMMAGAF